MKKAKGLNGPVVVLPGQLKLKEVEEMDFSKVGKEEIKGASPVIGVELVKHQSQLPATVEGLHDFILVGEQALKAAKAKIAAIKKVNLAHAAEEAALQDAQGLAEVVIEAKAKLGELLAALPKPKPIVKGSPDGSLRGTVRVLPEGITKKESHEAQTIAKHQDIAQKVIAKAKEEQRIPTPNEVYSEISAEERKKTIAKFTRIKRLRKAETK